uniref:LOW QUALITY PROTEIN: protein furry homolog-like n=1 Tax=Myxine glutinosa TaxID=7769 RepID=UPI00358FEF42
MASMHDSGFFEISLKSLLRSWSSSGPVNGIGRPAATPERQSSKDRDAQRQRSSRATEVGQAMEMVEPTARPCVDPESRPGEFVVKSMFAEFAVQADRKLNAVRVEPLEKPLSKSLQRSEDPHFDQLIGSLSAVAEYCLPSLLRSLLAWYWRQRPPDDSPCKYQPRANKGSRGEEQSKWSDCDHVAERHDLAMDFIMCLVLIDVLKQIPLHPVPDVLLQDVINLSFKHFSPREGYCGPNLGNLHIVADLYAEVIGVLAQSKFQAVRKKFLSELKDLRQREQSPHITQTIISLIMGLKFFRVKMYPVEEFEDSFQFMKECGEYFLEVKDKDVKHTLAGLFVEILIPVAATVKNEVNVPCLRNFVEMLYPTTFELSSRRKHSLALFPLVTCLLCVSQKQFFLTNWHVFMNNCLSQLKIPASSTIRKQIDSLQNKDAKMSRVALESLYRLLWVYMIRVKGESNSTTYSRLQCIVSALFPKGSRNVVPRDTPLNIFVKIIQFIAQERLDYAMKEIIYDLLNLGGRMARTFTINPERMNVGLRAFLVIADSLQRKAGEPPMPTTTMALPSGSTLRVKNTFLNKTLTEDEAKAIGMSQYYSQVCKVLDLILRQLDKEVGRNMTLAGGQPGSKDTEITGERKPKIELFRTCVAAIPRLIPDGMNRPEFLEMLSRLTTHVDEELRGLAYSSLQSLVQGFAAWRSDIISAFIAFTLRELPDAQSGLLEGALRMLLQLLGQWRLAITRETKVVKDYAGSPVSVLCAVEGLALVMLCSTLSTTRKLAVLLLKEIQALFQALCLLKDDSELLIDVLDKLTPSVVQSFLHLTKLEEQKAVLYGPVSDLQWLSEWSCELDSSDYDIVSSSHVWLFAHDHDPWLIALSTFLGHEELQACQPSLSYAWVFGLTRLQMLMSQVDSSIFATTKRPSTGSTGDSCLNGWRNYLLLCCSLAPGSSNDNKGLAKTTLLEILPPLQDSSFDGKIIFEGSVVQLFHSVVPLLRSESSEIAEALVMGLGRTNPSAFRDLMEELHPIIKESLDKKQENVRKRKRRDLMRIQLIRLFELLADGGVNSQRSRLEQDSRDLHFILLEYLDQMRQLLEAERERDSDLFIDARLQISALVSNLITHLPVAERNEFFPQQGLRHSLFHLISQWAGPFSLLLRPSECTAEGTIITRHNFVALKAMTAVLCCGPLYEGTGITMDDYFYSWLDRIINCPIPQVHNLGIETAAMLLELNPTVRSLLRWSLFQCYAGPSAIGSGCFTAIAITFCNREWLAGMPILLSLILFKATDPSREIQELAMQLLQILAPRFFYYASTSCIMGRLLAPTSLLPPLFTTTAYSLSEELSQTYPELTLPLFSEISQRFTSTSTRGRRALLSLLQPWLANIQLLDWTVQAQGVEGLEEHELTSCAEVSGKHWLKGSGWGSEQASELILNNLMYITAQYVSEAVISDFESVWTSLARSWPDNLPVILHFLTKLCGVHSEPSLMASIKKVAIYLCREKTVEVLEVLLPELQRTDVVVSTVSRTRMPPYYRFLLGQKSSPVNEPSNGSRKPLVRTRSLTAHESDYGVICHDDSPGTPHRHAHLDSRRSNGSGSSLDEEREPPYVSWRLKVSQSGSAQPLPMPVGGGIWLPLVDYLPEIFRTSPTLYRCNVVLVLLTDLVMDSGLCVEWKEHLPLLLQAIIMGLDHHHPVVLEHAKRLLLHLLLLLDTNNSLQHSAALLLAKSVNAHSRFLTTSPPSLSNSPLLGRTPLWPLSQSSSGADSALSPSSGSSASSLNVLSNASGTLSIPVVTVSEVTNDGTHKTRELVEFLSTRRPGPLWNYEDVSSKNLAIPSTEQLTSFLQHVVAAFNETKPGYQLENRLSGVALDVALSSLIPHYVGRSLQIFRALAQPLNATQLSLLLSHLLERVADASEESQGIVMEVLLTLDAAVDTLVECSKQNFNRRVRSHSRHNASLQLDRTCDSGWQSTFTSEEPANLHRCRSASQKDSNTSEWEQHTRSPRGGKATDRRCSLGKTQSLTSLGDDKACEDGLTPSQAEPRVLLTTIFWLGVALLESDFENEYLLGVQLLEHILNNVLECCASQVLSWECLEKAHSQLGWNSFPGLQPLLLKGLTVQTSLEPSTRLLSRLTSISYLPIVDNPRTGFPLNMLCLLPHLIQNFDSPNEFCQEVATNIAKVCSQESNDKLSNLAHVMTLYAQHSYQRDCTSWINAVCIYVEQAYREHIFTLIGHLAELLDKCLPSMQQSLLLIMHSLITPVDISAAPSRVFNIEIMKVVSKFVQTSHWCEALAVLKLVVGKFASRVPSELVPANTYKGLPGKSLEFQFDVSEIPVVSKRREHSGVAIVPRTVNVTRSTSSACVSAPSTLLHLGWKRPQLCQRRVRERLVGVLSLCDDKGFSAKSPPQVVVLKEAEFEALEGAEEIVMPADVPEIKKQHENDGAAAAEQPFGVFREFDFLDVELEDAEGESMDNFNWGVHRHTLNSIDKEDPSQRGAARLAGSASILTRLPGDDTDDSSDDDRSAINRALLRTKVRSTSSGADASTTSADARVARRDTLGHARETNKELESNDMGESEDSTLQASSVGLQHSTLCDVTEKSLSSLESEGNEEEEENVHWSEIPQPPPPAPFFKAILAAFRPAPSEDMEDAWRQHLVRLVADTDGSCAVYTFIVVFQLFQGIQRSFRSLTYSAVGYLGSRLHSIGLKFMSSLDVLLSNADCPTIFIDAETLLSCNLLDKLKFSVLELQEHLDTYNSKREGTQQWLEECHRIFEEEEGNEISIDRKEEELDEMRLELCRQLYKLHFQLLLLFQAYSKFIAKVEGIRENPQLLDLSTEMERLRGELQLAYSDSPPVSALESQTSPSVELSDSSEEAIQRLIECLNRRELYHALQLIRTYRAIWPDDLFGRDGDDEVPTLLNIYFRHQTLGQTGAWAIVGSNNDLSLACSKLAGLNLQLDQSLRRARAYRHLVGSLPHNQVLSTSF